MLTFSEKCLQSPLYVLYIGETAALKDGRRYTSLKKELASPDPNARCKAYDTVRRNIKETTSFLTENAENISSELCFISGILHDARVAQRFFEDEENRNAFCLGELSPETTAVVILLYYACTRGLKRAFIKREIQLRNEMSNTQVELPVTYA